MSFGGMGLHFGCVYTQDGIITVMTGLYAVHFGRGTVHHGPQASLNVLLESADFKPYPSLLLSSSCSWSHKNKVSQGEHGVVTTRSSVEAGGLACLPLATKGAEFWATCSSAAAQPAV